MTCKKHADLQAEDVAVETENFFLQATPSQLPVELFVRFS